MLRDRMLSTLGSALLMGSLFVVRLVAQETPVAPAGTQVATQQTPAAASNAEELRKQSQNPVANLISVPFENLTNFDIGPANRTQNILNIEPVIPVSVAKNWNLITRWIMPIIYQPPPVLLPPASPLQKTGVFGFGDLNR